MTDVAIVGASGYTALELVRILLRHPAARVVNEPVMSLDVFPTVVAMAKGQLSPTRRRMSAGRVWDAARYRARAAVT